MANGVIVKSKVAATNVDAYNATFISAANIDNGSVFGQGALSTTAGQGEVFTAVQPATGALTNLFMAASPESVLVTANGKSYRGIDPDPRDFTNVAGYAFDGFKPQIGDIILMSADCFTGTYTANYYAVATDGQYKLNWASAAVTGLSLKVLNASAYISIGTGAITSQRVAAYLCQVTAI